ncbi:hypothetical protein [Nocardioides sp. W7]|uniref:hypothetical protein n=1 Tax=Nocardioides sp. W7 TaxID=2931390 RepID=UPI001FD1D3B4|nr:hypothetical protein [Nocardioides sp. W7]
MKTFLKSRVTYANVASTLAIVMVVGGGGTAVAAGLARNSVGSPQLKAGAVKTADLGRNAVTSVKVRNNTLTGADIQESTLGQVPSAGVADRATNVLAATVQTTGTLVPGQSRNAVSSVKIGTGQYEVAFDRNVRGCAIAPSLSAPGVGGLFNGEIHATGRAGNDNAVQVVTFTSAGAFADRPFAVLVVC